MHKDSQNEIGREIIADLGHLPKYGDIIWWDNSNDHPFDGATSEWGIDIRTINRNDLDHYYDPDPDPDPDDIKGRYPHSTHNKNEAAQQMGVKGILGILVVLDYRISEADIYIKEMPLRHHLDNDNMVSGVYKWHKKDASQVLTQIPFENPYHNWRHPISAA